MATSRSALLVAAFDPLLPLGVGSYAGEVGFNTLFIIFMGAFLLLTVSDVFRGLRDGSVRRMTRRERVLTAIGVAGMLNFLTFLFVGAILGGDAINGRVEEGHYFLGSHGIYTEVSHRVFVYSACHGYSAIFGFLAMVAASLELQRPRWWRPKDNR